MAGDVEEFLRRLIERQMGQQQPPAGGAPPPPAPGPVRPQPPRPLPRPELAPRPPGSQPGRSAPPRPLPPQPSRRPVPQILQAEVIDEVEIVDVEAVSGDDVAAEVNRHLNTSEFQSRTARLGAGVREEEEENRRHYEQVFGGGPKSALSKTTGMSSEAPTTSSGPTGGATGSSPGVHPLAADLFAALSSPRELRRALILGEVLRRPDFD